MKKRTATATAVVALALVGLGACSSEKKVIDNASPLDSVDVSLPEGVTIPDSFPTGDTLPGGVTIPNITIPGGDTIPDITIPGGGVPASVAGVSASCLAYLQALGGAFAGDENSLKTLEEGFKQLADVVPDDLKDDLEVLSEGYGLLAEKIRDGADPTAIYADPEVQALFSDTKFAEASSNFSAWLNNECEQQG